MLVMSHGEAILEDGDRKKGKTGTKKTECQCDV